MKRRIPILIIIVVLVVAGIIYALTWSRGQIVLTGIVTTDEVIVSPEIQGRLQELLVKEGDNVKCNDVLARIMPEEWQADRDYYSETERQAVDQVAEAEAQLKFQESTTSNQIAQAEANLSSAHAQVAQGEADLENARLTFQRLDDLHKRGVESAQAFDQARTSFDAAKARVDSLNKQAEAAQAAVAVAKSNAEQVAARHATLEATSRQRAAAGAQAKKARVRLGYTEIRAPIDGIVDVRAALQGEVLNPGQGIVTLINQDNLWVRADVEETYIDRVHIGDKMNVRLPSGAEREGTVFFRGVDASYATQRDVSRTKRDIKTFEIRLRCDNSDRSLAVGMTAYVTLPVGRPR
jgi:multidrug resistance efflux pump